MEFIKIRECLSVCVSLRHCCVPAVNVCVPVCACVCLIPTCLQLLVLFLLLLLLAKSNPWQRCLLAALTHTDTQAHAHTDTVTANWFAHSHTDTAKGFMLCCAVPWGGDFSAVAVAVVAVVVVAFLLALI